MSWKTFFLLGVSSRFSAFKLNEKNFSRKIKYLKYLNQGSWDTAGEAYRQNKGIENS